MNPMDPLSQLAPLREPGPVPWWPPAPGWWILGALLITLCVLGGIWLVRRYRANRYRRAGLRQLARLQQQATQGEDTSDHVAALNQLLKAVALRGFPRSQVASASGADWLEFLNRTGPPGGQFDPGFADAGYRREPADIDLAQLHGTARSWIKHHRSAA